MPTLINGSPTHILLIHLVVVFIPLAALFASVGAVWPAARRKLGVVSPLTALVALVFVPLTTHAGQLLDNVVNPTRANPLINRHVQLGKQLLWFAIALFVVSVASWWVGRLADRAAGSATGASAGTDAADGSTGGLALATRATTRTAVPTWVRVAVAVVTIAVSVVTVLELVRIGDAGSKAVWSSLLPR